MNSDSFHDVQEDASPAREKTIRVAIVEDREEIRFGLTRLIGGAEGFECCGEYRSMEEALEGLPNDLPDVVLNDIGLPKMSGIEGIRILKEKYPDLSILILTVFDDDDRIAWLKNLDSEPRDRLVDI